MHAQLLASSEPVRVPQHNIRVWNASHPFDHVVHEHAESRAALRRAGEGTSRLLPLSDTYNRKITKAQIVCTPSWQLLTWLPPGTGLEVSAHPLPPSDMHHSPAPPTGISTNIALRTPQTLLSLICYMRRS